MNTAAAALTLPAVTPFDFEGLTVRVLDRDEDGLWFIARDVANLLEYRMASDLTRLLDDDERGTQTVRTHGGEQELLVISEPGLYRALIQRRTTSKMNASFRARLARFQRWIFHDVLPSIRETGGYRRPASQPPIDLNDPAALRTLLLSYSDQNIELKKEVDHLRPSHEALERISEADGSFCITDAAKALQMRPKDLFAWLRQNGWIYRRSGSAHDLGYQSKTSSGMLEHKITTVLRGDGSEKVTEQVRITAKGMTRLAVLIKPAVRMIGERQ